MHKRSARIALAFALLCGCASPPQLTPVASGEALRVVVVSSTPTEGAIPIRNLALGEGVSAGAGTGAVAGGLWGLSCGPFAVLCVPLGAMAGLMSGTAAGAVVGATGALPQDKATLLRDRLNRVRQSHDLVEELRRNVVDRARQRWTSSDDPTSALLTLELQNLLLTSTRDDRIGLVVQVRVSVRPAGAPSAKTATASPPKLYEYVGPLAPLAIWLDEGSDFVETSFSNAGRQIAAQVVAEMSLQR